MRMCDIAAASLLVLLLVGAALASGGAGAEEELVLIQLIHRHGARSALVSSNQSLICPGGCGMLNAQGKDQLVSVGRYLRQRYNSPDNFPNGPLFPSEKYDPRVIASRSTNLPRTLQSAAGLLQGMFPNTSDFFPAISTVEFKTDTLLLVDAIPAFHVPTMLTLASIEADVVRPALLPLIPQAVAETIGIELSLDTTCSNASRYVVCVLESQDVAASYAALGVLSNGSFPTALSYYPQLQMARRTLNSAFYPYNASSPLDKARGSLGLNIVLTMIRNMHAKLEKTSHLEQLVMHYSAHDTTVMPFAATLGNEGMMLPPFGQTYVIELWRRTDDASAPPRVRAYQGLPGDEPDNHTFVPSDFPLHCIDANGTGYVVPSYPGSCMLDDFVRFVNSSLPESPSGQCYLSDADFAKIGGNVVGSDQVPSPSSLVAFYRMMCPAQACPVGAFLNANLSCSWMVQVTDDVRVDNNSVTSRDATFVAAGSALGGFLLGVVAIKLLPVFLGSGTRKKNERYTPVNDGGKNL